MSSKSIYSSSLCSCIICKKILSVKGIHSHFIKSHTPDGNEKARQNGRLASRSSAKSAQQASKIVRIDAYNKNPSTCSFCSITLPYEKRHSKFCSQSCSGKSSNLNRPKGHPSRSKGNDKRSIVSSMPKVCQISFCVVCGKLIKMKRNKTCSSECKSVVLSTYAKNNTQLGGNKNNKAHGWYDSPIAGRVWLESSYEYRVACDLDKYNINWVRPSYLYYLNQTKKYYPDFYLVDYDVYLDPKNDYLIEKDKPKIEAVVKENGVKVIILTKQQLSWKQISNELGVGIEPTVS